MGGTCRVFSRQEAIVHVAATAELSSGGIWHTSGAWFMILDAERKAPSVTCSLIVLPFHPDVVLEVRSSMMQSG